MKFINNELTFQQKNSAVQYFDHTALSRHHTNVYALLHEQSTPNKRLKTLNVQYK